MPKHKTRSENPKNPKYTIESISKIIAKVNAVVINPTSEMTTMQTVTATQAGKVPAETAIQSGCCQPDADPTRSRRQAHKVEDKRQNGCGYGSPVGPDGCDAGQRVRDANFRR